MATDWSDNILISDLSDEPALSDELQSINERLDSEEGRPPHVVLNFASVSYVNSSNIAQVLRLRKVLSERDRKLLVCSVADEVWSVILLTGLDKILQFVPDKATAIASLQIEASGD